MATSVLYDIRSDLVESMRTWQDYLEGLDFLCHWDETNHRIIVDLIRIPVAYRRQGLCGQILDELLDFARAYEAEVWLKPDDSFGTPRHILERTYTEYGFDWADDQWMKRR